MSQVIKIAVREYLAYVRTWGFWISLGLLPVSISTIAFAPLAVARSAPSPTVAIVDLSGHNVLGSVTKALSSPGDGGKPVAIVVPPPGAPFSDAAAATARLRAYLSGTQGLPGGGQLDAAAILSPAGNTVAIDVWSRNVADHRLQNIISDAVKDSLRRERLADLGVNAKMLGAIDSLEPRLTDYSPKAEAGRISMKDRVPAFAGLVMGLLLWMVVLTGAGMLLNSVMEEKTSRILEVLLTSASVPEIMGGKILGVAAVTGTVLMLWMSIGGVLLAVKSPELAATVGGVLISDWRWAYFALYFLGGYMMFATLYVTIGAFCETSREAQTLLGPMMIIMTAPLLFMIQSLTHPDAPLLRILTWVPIFTPFMMAARAASGPPAWEVVATGLLMLGVTSLELWVAIPAFKTGALSSGRFQLKTFFSALAQRSAP